MPTALFRLLVLLLLTGCAAVPPSADTLAVDALLVGEQHDAEEHRDAAQQWVSRLAARGALAALALEMVDRGRSTEGLRADASEAQVREALNWDAKAWPWERYGAILMTAVRAGVPVLGANLPREQHRRVLSSAVYDNLLSAEQLAAQQQAIRAGHCNLLPEQHVLPLTRIQIARDNSMAFAVAGAAVPGKTVVLVAGSAHVHPELGVPRHLPPTLTSRSLVLPQRPTGKDDCEELRKQFRQVPQTVS
jgi:uncharacterized iron-regulated protein